ncbi:MAG: DNA polymerase IV [Acidobacteria bacterium]|nr:DNA polymerase IV [Acidobacteriota bacterium]
MLNGIDSVFAHVDMDSFFVSVELARHPELAGKRVVVGGGRGSRPGVVAAASYEARAFGVRSGISVLEAKRRCPGLVIIRPDHQLYESVSRNVMEILRGITPDIQVLSVDEALLDLKGVLRLWGPPMAIAGRIHREVQRKAGVPCSIGLARFPLVAKVASRLAKQNGICMILPREEEAFLYDHRISMMPGVGRATSAYLKYFDVVTVGDLVNRAPLFWERLLLTRPVENPFPKSISSELTLDRDTQDRKAVRAVLRNLCRKAAYRMRNRGLKAGGISVRVRYGDFQCFERHQTGTELRYDFEIIKLAEVLFKAADCFPLPVRLVGVRLAPLSVDGGSRALAVAPRSRAAAALYRTMDRIQKRYGHGALLHGR